MNWKDEYRSKLCNHKQAAKVVKSGDRLLTPIGLGEPSTAAMDAVADRKDELKDISRLPENLRQVKAYHSRDHMRNFLDCVKSRKPTIAPVEAAHHSAVPGHLGLIALLTGRKLKWDPKQEVIVGDAEASKLLAREYRSPWKLG